MNQLLTYFLNLFKSWDKGELALYSDPSSPADLGSPLTQDEIDFVKKLKKEMDQRFDASICSAEKSDATIANNYYQAFEAHWTNPPSFTGTKVTYRVSGTTIWKTPNALGNATGAFSGSSDSFIFDSGLIAGETYDILLQNVCPGGSLSDGVIISGTTTNAAP